MCELYFGLTQRQEYQYSFWLHFVKDIVDINVTNSKNKSHACALFTSSVLQNKQQLPRYAFGRVTASS